MSFIQNSGIATSGKTKSIARSWARLGVSESPWRRDSTVSAIATVQILPLIATVGTSLHRSVVNER